MIVLQQNVTNKVFATCWDKKNDKGGDNYLIRFVNDQTKDQCYCTVQDVSPSPMRYQLFGITTTSGSTTGTDGNINLPLGGFYTYYIYEADCIGCIPDVTQLNCVEIGKAKMVAAAFCQPTFESLVNPGLFVYSGSPYDTAANAQGS